MATRSFISFHCRSPKDNTQGVSDDSDIVVGFAIPKAPRGLLTAEQVADITALHISSVPRVAGATFAGYNSEWVKNLQTARADPIIYSFEDIDGPAAAPSGVKKWDVMHVGVISGSDYAKVAPCCELSSHENFDRGEGRLSPWAYKALSALLSTLTPIRFAGHVEAHASGFPGGPPLPSVATEEMMNVKKLCALAPVLARELKNRLGI